MMFWLLNVSNAVRIWYHPYQVQHIDIDRPFKGLRVQMFRDSWPVVLDAVIGPSAEWAMSCSVDWCLDDSEMQLSNLANATTAASP